MGITHTHQRADSLLAHMSGTELIMPPISKDCSNTFLERSFIYAAPCEWNKLSECIRTSTFDSFRKSVKNNVIYTTIWVMNENS